MTEPRSSYAIASQNRNSNLVLSIVCRYPKYHADGDFYGEKLRRFGVTYLVGIESKTNLSFLDALSRIAYKFPEKNDNNPEARYNNLEQLSDWQRRRLIALGYTFD